MKPELLIADFGRAIDRLEEALNTPAEDDVRRAGCIQFFEFTFELAWKAIKATGEQAGLTDLNSPRNCLRQAFRQGWILREEPWLEMLDARNRMSHVYDSLRALAVYEALPRFLPALRQLHSTLAALPLET